MAGVGVCVCVCGVLPAVRWESGGGGVCVGRGVVVTHTFPPWPPTGRNSPPIRGGEGWEGLACVPDVCVWRGERGGVKKTQPNKTPQSSVSPPSPRPSLPGVLFFSCRDQVCKTSCRGGGES